MERTGTYRELCERYDALNAQYQQSRDFFERDRLDKAMTQVEYDARTLLSNDEYLAFVSCADESPE